MTTVLLVEDEADILGTQAELLRYAGFDVLTSPSATEALQILSKEHVDVMLSDIRLGKESGLELAYTVHREYPSVGVILTTGYSGGNNEIRWPLIMKPYLCEQAVAVINKVMMQNG